MRVIDEIRVKNAAGHEVIMQKVGNGISYLDFGNTHLPRNFEGVRVKYSDRIAHQLPDGSFEIDDTHEVYRPS